MPKIVQIISENKSTKAKGRDSVFQQTLYKSKIGYAEAIIEVNGKKKTAHMVSLKDYEKQKN